MVFRRHLGDRDDLLLFLLTAEILEAVERRTFHLLLLNLLKIASYEVWMVFDVKHVAQTKPLVGLWVSQLLYQVLELRVLDLRPVNVVFLDLVVNYRIVLAHEHLPAASHFVDDAAEGPQIGKEAGFILLL